MATELYFNIDNGYLEGLCRGFRGGILTKGDYLNLIQCETVDGTYSVEQIMSENTFSVFDYLARFKSPTSGNRLRRTFTK